MVMLIFIILLYPIYEIFMVNLDALDIDSVDLESTTRKESKKMTKVTKMDQKQQFVELRAKGVPYDRIVEDMGVSKPTLIKWGRELELEICNRKALEWEVIQEKYYVSKVKRVELFGEELTRLNGEIERREYSEMSLKELVELKLKYAEKLKQEETEITLKEKGSIDDSLEILLNKSSYIEWKA
jgi:hypothetical protein